MSSFLTLEASTTKTLTINHDSQPSACSGKGSSNLKFLTEELLCIAGRYGVAISIDNISWLSRAAVDIQRNQRGPRCKNDRSRKANKEGGRLGSMVRRAIVNASMPVRVMMDGQPLTPELRLGCLRGWQRKNPPESLRILFTHTWKEVMQVI